MGDEACLELLRQRHGARTGVAVALRLQQQAAAFIVAQQRQAIHRRGGAQYHGLEQHPVVAEQPADRAGIEQFGAVFHARHAAEVGVQDEQAQVELRRTARDLERHHADVADGGVRHG